MRELFVVFVLLFSVSCGSKEKSDSSAGGTNDATNKGNSAGSNIIEMDTSHMDTSSHKAPN